MVSANEVWLTALDQTKYHADYETAPRGHKIQEIVNYNYQVNMNFPVITHKGRDLNYPFMFGEAAWILQGRNDLEFIKGFMKSYERFSDDGLTLNGAYGPKIMDQISWAANELANDLDSRRCYINIWRERPGPSKDLPCTNGMQFIVRDNKLHMLVNMRSQDVVWGMPYDMFTFSAVAKYLQIVLWTHKNIGVELGTLFVRSGSMHLYEHHFDNAQTWLNERSENDNEAEKIWARCCATTKPHKFVSNMLVAAVDMRSASNDNH